MLYLGTHPRAETRPGFTPTRPGFRAVHSDGWGVSALNKIPASLRPGERLVRVRVTAAHDELVVCETDDDVKASYGTRLPDVEEQHWFAAAEDTIEALRHVPAG